MRLFSKTLLTDIMPLVHQFGQDETKTMPDALHRRFFHPNDDTESQVFAILDAAKVINLVELIETSGLDHRCLFKGNATDDLGAVGPWLVTLSDGDVFTRNLFTSGSAAWHLWETAPGILLRSSASLDTLWKHFRKFTRLYDESRGRWVYFRFYDPEVMAAVLESYTSEQIDAFLGPATAIAAQTMQGNVFYCEVVDHAA